MSTGSKDGAFLADAKLAGGIDSNGREHPLNCDETGTLEVTGVVDVIPGSIFEITGEVEIKNDSGNPIPVTGTVTTAPSGTQTVAISQIGADNDVNVTGTVSVTNFPASVEISNDVGNPIPVSGTVTATPSGTQDVNIISSIAIPVTDNGGSLTVDGTFFQATQPVSGPLTDVQLRATPVPVSGTITTSPDVNLHDGTGVSISSTSSSLNVDVTNTVPVTLTSTTITGNVTVTQVTGTNLHTVVDNFPASVEVSNDVGNPLPISGTITANAGTGPFPVSDNGGSITVDGTFFQTTQPVSIAATVVTKDIRAATPAQSSVSVLTTNTTILAANANRLGATIYNESGATVYVKLGTTASLTSYTVQIVVGSYYEVPFDYTGNIDGITIAITGIVRVTELTN